MTPALSWVFESAATAILNAWTNHAGGADEVTPPRLIEAIRRILAICPGAKSCVSASQNGLRGTKRG